MKSYKMAFVNSKGGVGKSTLCMLAALGLGNSKFKGKVRLIDTDIQKSSISILSHVKNNIQIEFIPFNQVSPGLGASLLDQKLKAYARENEVILIDTMAHPPRQLINCLMQCDAIITPCNLSEIEISATIDFIKWLDGLKRSQFTNSPHLIIMPNRVPHNQVNLSSLINSLQEVDVIVGPTLSDTAVLRNGLSKFSLKSSSLPNRFRSQYLDFNNFILKALVEGGLDKLLEEEEQDKAEDKKINNVIPISA